MGDTTGRKPKPLQSSAGRKSVWAIVLAGGEGTRLRELTTDRNGRSVPKQFWSIGSGRSMLSQAMARASRIAGRTRVVVVVAAEHRSWWQPELAHFPAESVVVQPANRGTAAGILLPLLRILDRDRSATVLVVPSDHAIGDERVLGSSIHRAIRSVDGKERPIVLLGMKPESPETGYGWIVPAPGSDAGVSRVEHFVEKPEPMAAAALFGEGALWNSFLFVADGSALRRIYREKLPELLDPFLAREAVAAETSSLDEFYDRLPVRDFSRELLERSTTELSVVSVPPCGWSDLGTPVRVARFLGSRPARSRSETISSAPFALRFADVASLLMRAKSP